MLSISWIQDVDYYLDQTSADYYFRPGEPPGRWWGPGAKTLGLSGVVKAEELKSLCKGFSPTGDALIQNAGASDHQQAWDLTFSAPKSVSVLWTQAPRAARLKIRKLHHKAIQAALKYLTESALLTRRGKGGKIRERCNPIVAIFEHGSSRELEPQLHSHCVLLNVAGRADGTYGTILSDPFYKHKLTAGAIYRAELGHLLRKELGLKIERQDKAFAIVGVPDKLIDHYSTRRKQIKSQLHSKGKHSAKAAAAATLDTRKSKHKSPPPRAELLKRWQETNRQFGFTEAKAQQLLGKVAAVVEPPSLKKHITNAIGTLLESESYFSEQQLIRQVAIDVMGNGSSAAHIIEQVKAHVIENSDLVALGIVDHEAQFTTHDVLNEEKQLLDAIAQGKDDTLHLVGKSAVEQIVDRQLPLTPNLTDDEQRRNQEQRNAVRQLTTRPGNIQVMEGMAGTGKTYTLKVAREAWERAGYRVVGMALSGVAAGKLQEDAGIESETIALRLAQLDGSRDFKRHHKRQLKRLIQGKRTYAYGGPKFTINRKTIVVVDEAGMVGTRQMAKLIKQVRKAGAKLVLIGDRRQLQPIEAGAPFPIIADKTERAELQHVVRQKLEPDDPNPAWHREAGKLIAAGQVAQAINLFKERGRLTVQSDREQAMLSLVRDWSVKGMSNPDDHVILAGTRAEVAEINAACQSARLSAGAIGNDYVTIDDQQFHVGDTVIFTRISRMYHVNNGDRGIVTGFNRLTKTIAVRLASTQKVVVVPYKTYTDLQLGYAMTTHKAQGATMPSLYVLLGGPMQDRHLSYVQSTRACESTRLYVDKLNAGPDLKHLLNQMAKPRPKRLAHEVLSPIRRDETPSPAKPEKAIRTTDGEVGKPIAAKTRKAKSKKPSARQAKSNKPLDAARIEELLAQLRVRQPLTPNESGPEIKTSLEENQSASTPTLPTSPFDSTNPVKVNLAPELPTFSFPPLNFEIPRRDILDLSHLTISATTDRSVLEAAVARYGRLPGGIVVEGAARCDFPLYSLDIDPLSPGTLIINGKLRYDTGLTGEEIALLWQAVLECDRATRDFGVLSQSEAIGIDNDTLVANTMMKADNAFGGFVYGYDATFTLPKPNVTGYSNPFLSETYALTAYNAFDQACFNYLYDIQPRVFLQFTGVGFAEDGFGNVTAVANQVQAASAVAQSGGRIANSVPPNSGIVPTVAERFPYVHHAFQHFVANFSKFARSEPSFARCVAYAEVVMLLRYARTTYALLPGHDHIRKILVHRKHLPLPRYDYTLRSSDFVWTSTEIARYLARRTDSLSYESLVAAIVGFRYATLAGDFDSFVKCKQAAINCLTHLYRRASAAVESERDRELRALFEVVLDTVTNSSHDILIHNCIEAALGTTCTPAERSSYLSDALLACGTEIMINASPSTRCRWLEIKSLLDVAFDPVPGLAKVRAENVAIRLPFSVLSRVNVHRRPKSPWESTRDQILHAIDRLNTVRRTSFWERPDDVWNQLKELAKGDNFWHLRTRYTSLEDCLADWRRQHAADLEIRKSLSALVAVRFLPCPSLTFSTLLLHSANPFAESHALLNSETPEGLAFLFSVVRDDIEHFDSVDAEHWWRKFLFTHSLSFKTDASKVGLLIAYELSVRGLNVDQLYQKMRLYRTDNPQAALLLFDSDATS
jgi:conjugative relaxase-like TrwC/TraI family protein